jgi:hypothetical protein
MTMDARERPPEMYLSRKEREQVVQLVDTLDHLLGDKKCIHVITMMPISPTENQAAGFSRYFGLEDLSNGLCVPIFNMLVEVFKQIPNLPPDELKQGIVFGNMLNEFMNELRRKVLNLCIKEIPHGRLTP